MKGQALLSLAVLFVCTAGVYSQDAELQRLKRYLPEVQGWKLAEAPDFYDRSNLFDYIDGSCELYYSYGFVGLVSAVYESTENPDSALIVDIYDMGSPLGAFGVFSSSVYPTFSFEKLGCDGVVSELQVRFWQDRYEVELNGDVAKEVFVRFARAIGEKLPPCRELPELRWLPERGRVAHTLRYVPEALLGQDFMPPGFEAKYRVDTLVVRGFVARCPSADSAQYYLKRLRGALAKFEGAEIRESTDLLRSFHQHMGHLLAGVRGSWIFGAVSQESRQAAEAIFQQIEEHVRALEKEQNPRE